MECSIHRQLSLEQMKIKTKWNGIAKTRFIATQKTSGTTTTVTIFQPTNIVISVLSFLNGTRRADANFKYQPIADVDMDVIRRVNVH